MQIETHVMVTKPACRQWTVLGDQFGEAHLWGSALWFIRTAMGRPYTTRCVSRAPCDIQGMGRIREQLQG